MTLKNKLENFFNNCVVIEYKMKNIILCITKNKIHNHGVFVKIKKFLKCYTNQTGIMLQEYQTKDNSQEWSILNILYDNISLEIHFVAEDFNAAGLDLESIFQQL